MHISLFTNISKTQIRETDTHFNIERVPITVDDAVMNGILYNAQENKAGMPTIMDRVVTLSHPTDVKGNGADAYSGESLQKFYSGGHIETVYADNSVWYVNVSIKKSMLKIQDEEQGTDFYNRLSNKQDIGVSTGLYTEVEKVTGTNAKGEEYTGIAKNQTYNHLAMLESSEPPAGGDSTFMRFNSDGAESNLLVNLADYMPDSIPADNEPAVEVEVEQDDTEKFFTKFMAMLGMAGLLKGNDDKKKTNQSEDDPMDIKNMVAELKKANMFEENMSDDEVTAAFGKIKKDDDKSEPKGNSDKLATLINALTAKVEALESQLNAQGQAEKDELVNKLKGLDTGITENGLKALSVEDLQALSNKVEGQTFSLNSSYRGTQTTENLYDDVPE